MVDILQRFIRVYNSESRISGFIRIVFSHMLSFLCSLTIPFLLPLILNNDGYAYWQLHTLYAGYACIVLLGLNDGLHVNYSDRDYIEKNLRIYRTFVRVAILLSILGGIGVCIYSLSLEGLYCFIGLMISIEIPASCLRSVTHYINQSAMRYKVLSQALIIDKIVLIILVFICILFKVKNVKIYLIIYVLTQYVVLVYNIISTRGIYLGKAENIKIMIPELKQTFCIGIIHMVAITAYSSIFLPCKLIIQNDFGLIEFGIFSFSLNVLSIALQFITSFAQFFFPILKRRNECQLENNIIILDKIMTIIGSILIILFYFSYIAIKTLYPTYVSGLSYLPYLFPIFIYQCKSNLLIMNTIKCHKNVIVMFIYSSVGILINFLCAFLSSRFSGKIEFIALFISIGYISWYYIGRFYICLKYNWGIKYDFFSDVVYIIIFELIHILFKYTSIANISLSIACECIIYIFFIFVFYIIQYKNIKYNVSAVLNIINN